MQNKSFLISQKWNKITYNTVFTIESNRLEEGNIFNKVMYVRYIMTCDKLDELIK